MKEQVRTNAGMAQARQHQGGPLSLISCVSGREASPLNENDPRETVEIKTENKKKRFHPLRNLRRMFRRKGRRSSISDESYKRELPDSGPAPLPALEQRSCSTSRLLQDETSQNRTRNSGLAPGLSLSHDSVFTPDRGDSGHSSSDLENSSLSIPVSIPAPRFQAELADAVRRRNRGESEEEEEDEDEDLGLPRSPCSSLTTADVVRDKPQELVAKSQSSCSEGSLLSMESSDVELDPAASKSELDLSVTSQKLSHSAAKHKMAVRPKRNHGAPQGKRKTKMSGTALPATPEANEDIGIGSGSAPVDKRTGNPAGIGSSETFSPAESPSRDKGSSFSHDFGKKSASLPHGAALSSSPKIVRSRSNATSTRFRKRNSSNEETEDETGENPEERENKREESFFERLLPRRSGKKKKSELDSDSEAAKEEPSGEDGFGTRFAKKPSRTKNRIECKPLAGSRNADRRQRTEPAEVPSGPPFEKEVSRFGRSVSEGSNRMKISYSVSPPKSSWPNRAVSRSVSPPEAVWPKETERDEWTNLRINRYESNWEESSKAIDGRISPSVRFLKREIPAKNLVRRDFSPTKSETESEIKVRKSRSFGNFSVGVYGEERKRKGNSADGPDSESKSRGEEETGKRLYTKNSSATKIKCSRKEEKSGAPLPLPRKSASLDSVESSDAKTCDKISVKSVSSESFRSPFPDPGVVVTYEEPRYANLENLIPNSNRYEKIHHGYENIRIIELVKKETEMKTCSQSRPFEKTCEEKKETSPAKPKTILSEPETEPKPEPEPEPEPEFESDKKSLKPPVSEKPKESKVNCSNAVVPEFMRVQLNRVESRNSVCSASSAVDKSEPKKEDVPKAKSTLVERRKSELLPAEELENKNFKPKIKPIKKHTGFAEEPKSRSSLDESPKHVLVQKPTENVVVTEKTETIDFGEVVLRKKSAVLEKEEQPELMKVFARRSLKIKEDEELAEDVRKSRDSDKENDGSEFPKDERKRTGGKDGDKKGQVSTEPGTVKSKTVEEPVSKTSVFQRYGRSTSENGIPKRHDSEKAAVPERRTSSVDKENFFSELSKHERSKAWGGVTCDKILDATNATAEEGSRGDPEESGFKRIQQRKAEWERRMQQAAKR